MTKHKKKDLDALKKEINNLPTGTDVVVPTKGKKCPHGFVGGCTLCLVAGRRGDLTGRT